MFSEIKLKENVKEADIKELKDSYKEHNKDNESNKNKIVENH